MPENITCEFDPVDPRSWWRYENDFTDWLADNLGLLGENLGMDLKLVGKEVRVGDYRADILASEKSSRVGVVIENQLGYSDHQHLGQLITYASGLEACSVVWITIWFSDEHLRAIDWLNQNSKDSTEFFGVILSVGKCSSPELKARFEVVASPDVYGSSMKNRRKDPWNQKLDDFFSSLIEVPLKNRSFNVKSSSRPHHFEFHSPFENIWYNLAFDNNKVRVRLSLGDAEHRKCVYELLEGRRSEIDKEFEEDPDWVCEAKWGNESMISIYKCGSIDDQEDRLAEHADWMIKTLIKVRKVFTPRLNAIMNRLSGPNI